MKAPAAIFDVYLVRREIKRRNRVAADQVSWVALRRGPLDPYDPPPDATMRLGSFVARTKAEAIADARTFRPRAKRPLPNHRVF